MIDGLFLYEIILMLLGTLLFLVLLFLLVYSVIKNRDLKMIVLSFLLPVLMIGFPSIKKIQWDKGTVELERQVMALEARPEDQQLRASVEEKLAAITARPIENSAGTLVTVARAQNALGNDAQALVTIDKALQVSPQLPEAKQLKTAIVSQQNLKQDATELEEKTKQLEKNPGDPNLKTEVYKGIRKVEARSTVSPEVLRKLAHAQHVVGEQEQAIKTAREAVRIDPSAATQIAPLLKADPRILMTTTRPSPTVTPKPK